LSLVSAHDEALHVGLDGFNVEAVERHVLVQYQFKVAVILANNDVALVCANQDFVVGQPAVGSVNT